MFATQSRTQLPGRRIAGIDFFHEENQTLCLRRSVGLVLFWHVLPVWSLLIASTWLVAACAASLPLHRSVLFTLPLAFLLGIGLYAYVHTLRAVYRFDRVAGRLWYGKRAVCTLASIHHVAVQPVRKLTGRAGESHLYCRLLLLYATGEVYPATREPRLSSLSLFEFDSLNAAVRVGTEVACFLGVCLAPVSQNILS